MAAHIIVLSVCNDGIFDVCMFLCIVEQNNINTLPCILNNVCTTNGTHIEYTSAMHVYAWNIPVSCMAVQCSRGALATSISQKEGLPPTIYLRSHTSLAVVVS